MMQSSIQNISNKLNSYQQQNQQDLTPKETKEVMTPSELAKFMNIEMSLVYDMTASDSTMPYIEINGEYRFSKAAIEKWMETKKVIETK